MRAAFSRVARAVTNWAGSTQASMILIVFVAAALGWGFLSGFSRDWQTAVYSSCALVSVLMVFLIQHSTSRNTKAIILKLDELVHSSESARNDVLNIETRSVDEQEGIRRRLHGAD